MSVELIDDKCQKSCEGLYVTSYFKSEMNKDSFANFWSKVEVDYMKYKGRKAVNFPEELKGFSIFFHLKTIYLTPNIF